MQLTYEEQEVATQLEITLIPLQPVATRNDAWVCLLDRSSMYIVKSTYKSLIGRSDGAMVDDSKKLIPQDLWSTPTPSKFLVHAWRVLPDHLPTRVTLQQRGAISFNQGPSCVFCFRNHEEIAHLFFLCSKSTHIWQSVSHWL